MNRTGGSLILICLKTGTRFSDSEMLEIRSQRFSDSGRFENGNQRLFTSNTRPTLEGPLHHHGDVFALLITAIVLQLLITAIVLALLTRVIRVFFFPIPQVHW